MALAPGVGAVPLDAVAPVTIAAFRAGRGAMLTRMCELPAPIDVALFVISTRLVIGSSVAIADAGSVTSTLAARAAAAVPRKELMENMIVGLEVSDAAARAAE